MTAIVALTTGKKVYMGGDSAGVEGYSIWSRADEKVFHNGKFLIGFTDSFRMGQLLRYSFTPPKQPSDKNTEQYIYTTFINAVRKCFKKGGYCTIRNGEEEGGTFIVGYKGMIFEVEDDFQIAMYQKNYTAIGCGRDLCLGALHALESNTEMIPEEKIEAALTAAETFSAGVRSPFIYKSV